MDWREMPELECIPVGDSCIIGNELCYHPTSPREHAEHIAQTCYNEAAKANAPAVVWTGVARGYVPARLGTMLPDPVAKILWDPHPNLTRQIVAPPEADAIAQRWTVVRTAAEVAHILDGKPPPARFCHYGLNEMVHWQLGFVDWVYRDRNRMRSANILGMYPSPRAIQRIGYFGRIPGSHQLDGVGNRLAIVVSQGPGLTDCLDAVKLAAQRGAVIIAAAQAGKTLNDAGIIPHYLCVADPGSVMAEHVAKAQFGCVLMDGMAPMELAATPDLEGHRAYFQIMSTYVHQAVADMLQWPAFDDSFATVSEIMSQIAVQVLRAKRVVLVGCDFGARPDVAVNPWPRYKSSFRVPTYGGAWTWTNAHYNHARHYMEHMIGSLPPGTLHRYSVGIPVDGEARIEHPGQIVKMAGAHKPYIVRVPKARESDIIGASVALNLLRQKGLDLNNATNDEHPECIKYDFSALGHSEKVAAVDGVLNPILSPTGSVV